MFDNIAHAYDKLNHTLSLGIDRRWRKKAIAWLRPFQPQRMMDVATGTGDFAILACRKLQPAELIGTDISEGMMNVGREKVKKEGLSDKISFAREDCTSLSFADNEYCRKHGVLFPVLCNQKMNAYLKELADICGIKKTLTTHVARHTFATFALANGVSIESVAKMLGHTNVQMTRHYARVLDRTVIREMSQIKMDFHFSM